MKIPVPKSIKVGGHTYGIEFTPYLKSDDGCKGVVNLRTGRITIDSNIPDKVRVLIHEVLHIVNVVWLNNELGEAILNNLSEGLYAVMVDAGIEIGLEVNDAIRSSEEG